LFLGFHFIFYFVFIFAVQISVPFVKLVIGYVYYDWYILLNDEAAFVLFSPNKANNSSVTRQDVNNVLIDFDFSL